MKDEALALWDRALGSLRAARTTLPLSANVSAPESYFAAFQAVSAHFRLTEQEFIKHSGVEAAVHRELVHSGLWPAELGKAYSNLNKLRHTGHYEVGNDVTKQEAERAVADAQRILCAVQQMHPDLFADPESLLKDNPPV